MQPHRAVTPHQEVETLFTGHFVSIAGYEAYRPAGTNDYLLIYTLAGLGQFVTPDSRRHLLKPHDMLLVAPHTAQDYGVESSLEHWELIWTHFRPRSDWLDLLDWPTIEPGVMRLTVREESPQRQIIEQFQRVHRSAMSAGALRDRIAMNALEALLLMAEQINPNQAAHTTDSRIRLAMDHVTRHLESRITLDGLANLTGLSPSRLGHRFREVVGVSPMEFVERQRIDRARQLLTMTSLSVKEISRQVGYETQFYFSLRFKKSTGQSPKAFRELAISR
jgi:AraC family transcriptional regulator of arabinose operon